MQGGFLKYIGKLQTLLSKQWILTSIFFALVLSMLWTPLDSLLKIGESAEAFQLLPSERVESFSREMGQALASGIDIAKRISNLKFYGFFYLPILFLAIWFLLSLLFKNRELDPQSQRFLKRVVFASLPCVILTCMLRLNASFAMSFHTSAYMAVLCLVLYFRFGRDLFSLEQFKCIFFCAFSLLFLGIRLEIHFNPIITDDVVLFFLGELLSYFCAIVLLSIFALLLRKWHKLDLIWEAYIPFFLFPVLSSFALEIINILCRYGVYISSPLTIICLLFLCMLLLSLTRIRKTNPQVRSDENHTLQLFLLVVGVAMLALQPSRQIIAGTELFESSNAGSDVYAFLTAGEIPLVDNLNAHMVVEEIGAILYGFLNRDSLGAIWFSYPIISFASYMLFFWLFCLLSDSESSALILMLFPIFSIDWLLSPLHGAAIGLFPICSAIVALKKKNRSSALLFALSCGITVLYRADIGLASTGSAIIVLVAVLLLQKDYRTIRSMLLTGCATAAGFFVAFLIACFMRNVSPLMRILEAVSILKSNISWSYSQLSVDYDILFFLCHLFVPTAVTVCMIISIIRAYHGKMDSIKTAALLMLALTYFFCFGRGIVRHSLLEQHTVYTLGYGVLFLLLFLWVKFQNKAECFSICLCGVLAVQLICGASFGTESSMLQKYVNTQIQTGVYQSTKEKIDRVIIPETLKAVYEPLKTVFDSTLTPEQSYIDYSNSTMLYALTGRNKPVYVNQSPALLNKEFDQLLFIQETERIDCPYALSLITGSGFDGLDEDMKHYLVAEYRNANYKPICMTGNYMLWVRNEEYKQRHDELEKLVAEKGINLTFLHENDPMFFRTYELGEIPWLWGKFDRVESQEVLKEVPLAENPKLSIDLRDDGTGLTYAIPVDVIPEEAESAALAVWCSTENGQDDLIWYPLERIDIEHVGVDILFSDHLDQIGNYEFHLYYYLSGGTPVLLDKQERNISSDRYVRDSISYVINPNIVDRSDGNYMELIIQAEKEGHLTLCFENENKDRVCMVGLDIEPGNERYMIRISGNWIWYTDEIQSLHLVPNIPIEVQSVRILRGDIDYGSMNAVQRAVLSKDKM